MKNFARTKLLALTVAFLLVFALPGSVHAQGIVYGDRVPARTVVDQDILLVGQNVTIDGTVNGNVFILGNQVIINGEINGSLILIGQNASIGGSVSGGVYALVLTLDLGPNADLGRDLYVATVSLTSGRETLIGRDLYAVGLDAGLNGQVGRDLHTTIGPIQLYNSLMRLLGFEGLTLNLRIGTPQTAPKVDSLRIPVDVTHHFYQSPKQENTTTFDWGNWALTQLRTWIVLFLLALLVLWRWPTQLKQDAEQLREKPLRTIGIGLLALVIAINLFVVGLLIAALIFAIGLGLNALGLWQISLAFWVLAYASLLFLLALLWAFILYGTKIIAIYTLAAWSFERLFHKKVFWLDTLALLAGTLVYTLLLAIPYVGWAFGLLASAAGMGAAWRAWRLARRERLSVEVNTNKGAPTKPIATKKKPTPKK